MQGTGAVPNTLILIVLLFVPGVLGLDFYYLRSEKVSTLSRTQILVYSAGISIASILLMYLFSPIFYNILADTSTSAANRFGIVTEPELASIKISSVVTLYLTHILVTLSIGWVVGSRHKTDNSDRRDPWHYAFDVIPSDGDEVEVMTSDGTTVQGEYNQEAWDENCRELFLDDPYEVEYAEDDGQSIDRKSDLGRSILIQENSISKVIFVDKDPDKDHIQPTELETDIKESTDENVSEEGIYSFLSVEQTTLYEFEDDEGRSQESPGGTEQTFKELGKNDGKKKQN